MRWAALALLLLGACTRADRDPVTAACEQQADSSPDVKLLLMKAAGTPQLLEENQDLMRDARRRATQACLRGRGVTSAGGVEAPQRSRSLFNGL